MNGNTIGEDSSGTKPLGLIDSLSTSGSLNLTASEPVAAAAESATLQLPRVLGVIEAIAIVVGSVIGSGIFLVPRTVADEVGCFGLVVLVWLVGGLLTVLGALTYAELAAMMPSAGGEYVFLREAYGPLWAFLSGWTALLVARTGSCAALSVAFALSLSQIVPLSPLAAKLISLLAILLLAVVNILGTRKGGNVQNVTTYVKATFLALIAMLPFLMGRAHLEHWAPIMASRTDRSLVSAFCAAMIAALWAYGGWPNLAIVAEEVRDPQRVIPRALMIGVAIVTLLYVSANLAYHSVLPMQEIARAPHVAAAVLERLLGTMGKTAIAAVVMCSTFGGVNASLLVAPRIYFAMARDGVFFSFLHSIHPRFETPASAIGLQAACSILLLLCCSLFTSAADLPDLFSTLTAFVVFGGSIFYTMSIAAVFVLRRKQPDLPRPYRTWGYPAVPIVSVLTYTGLLVTTLIDSPIRSGIGLALIASGIPVFWCWSRKP